MLTQSRSRRWTHLIGATGVGVVVALTAGDSFAQTKPPLTVAIQRDLTTLDPHRISAGTDDNLFGNVMEPLYGVASDGSLEPVLATSVAISEDGLTYDFKLRENVKFHNGDPFTAEDVRYSWERGVDPKSLNPRAVVVLRNIADIEIVDPLRVRMKLKTADAATLPNMEGTFLILSKKYMTEGAGKDEATRAPMGTGPFIFVERKVREYLKLKSFDGHWGRVPQVGEVTMRIVPDAQTRFAMLQTGEADLISAVPAFLAKKEANAKDYKIISRPGYNNLYFQIHTRSTNPDLKKPEVRRALNMAINKKQIFDAVTFGFAAAHDGAPCSGDILGCNPVPAGYGFDPKAAREMLVKAGFDFNRPLRIVAPASGATILQSRETAEAVAFFLQQIGVKTQLDIKEYGAWLAGDQQAAQPKNPNTDIVMSIVPDYNPNPSARLRRAMMTDGIFSWISDPELDETIGKLNTIVNDKEREAHAKAMWKTIREKSPSITLWAWDAIYGARRNINWQPQFGPLALVLYNVRKD